jgi:2-iminoacetate synthase
MLLNVETTGFIDEGRITDILDITRDCDATHVREVLAKARELKGLDFSDVAVLMNVEDPQLLEELYETGSWIKDEIYGSRLVIFAPLYVSNYCGNECDYCAFRASNRNQTPRLDPGGDRPGSARPDRPGPQAAAAGAGESYPESMGGFDYILRAIETVYATKHGRVRSAA